MESAAQSFRYCPILDGESNSLYKKYQKVTLSNARTKVDKTIDMIKQSSPMCMPVGPRFKIVQPVSMSQSCCKCPKPSRASVTSSSSISTMSGKDLVKNHSTLATWVFLNTAPIIPPRKKVPRFTPATPSQVQRQWSEIVDAMNPPKTPSYQLLVQ